MSARKLTLCEHFVNAVLPLDEEQNKKRNACCLVWCRISLTDQPRHLRSEATAALLHSCRVTSACSDPPINQEDHVSVSPTGPPTSLKNMVIVQHFMKMFDFENV
ncbi:hypothetical protein FOCC_FOCC000126 [Frankliniella occidentalis]|nr:hypothetical protein FOCC_FOCC000126 [Frankliniella occidentalis]